MIMCIGSYVLQLRLWEHRQIAKILIVLELYESGDNWSHKAFKWTIDSEQIPGWVLTKSWVTGM